MGWTALLTGIEMPNTLYHVSLRATQSRLAGRKRALVARKAKRERRRLRISGIGSDHRDLVLGENAYPTECHIMFPNDSIL